MSPINGVNERGFFPVNFSSENGASITSADNNLEHPSAASPDSHSDIQTNFQTILDSLIGAGNGVGVGSSETGTDITDALSSLTGLNNNSSAMISVLEQMAKTDTSSQDSDQTENQLLNQFLGATKINSATSFNGTPINSTPVGGESTPVESQNGSSPIADVPTARVISNYQQAMREFQKAFNLLPTEKPAETNPNPAKASLIEDSGAPTLGMALQGVNPTQQQVIGYITEQCRQMGIPAQLGLATAATESGMLQYNKNGTPLQNSNPDSADWGLMQINDRAWGDVYDLNLIQSDWKYNVRVGLQILKESFDTALQNNEGSKGANSSLQNLVRAAYSGYNAGVGNIWRYRTPVNDAPQAGSYDVLDNKGYDLRDIRFWENYQKFS